MNLKNIGIDVSTHHRSSSGEKRCARSCGKPLNEAQKLTMIKSGIHFNEICVQEGLQPNFTNIYIYIYIYTHTQGAEA